MLRSSGEWPTFEWTNHSTASGERRLEAGLVARAAVNPARSNVVDWILSGDELLIVTNAGVIQAIDANTGATLWTTQFGNPRYPSLGPAANDEFAAVINGSKLYLLDCESGRIVGKRPVGGVPGAGPAFGSDYVFVPTINGLIEGYPLDPDAKNLSGGTTSRTGEPWSRRW